MTTHTHSFIAVYTLAVFVVITSIVGFLFLALSREEERHTLIQESFHPKDLVESVKECFLHNHIKRDVFNPRVQKGGVLVASFYAPKPFKCDDSSGAGWDISFNPAPPPGIFSSVDSIKNKFSARHHVNGEEKHRSQEPCRLVPPGNSPIDDTAECRTEEWKFLMKPPNPEGGADGECAMLRVRRECHELITDPEGHSGVCAGDIRTEVVISAYAQCPGNNPDLSSPSHTRQLRYQ